MAIKNNGGGNPNHDEEGKFTSGPNQAGSAKKEEKPQRQPSPLEKLMGGLLSGANKDLEEENKNIEAIKKMGFDDDEDTYEDKLQKQMGFDENKEDKKLYQEDLENHSYPFPAMIINDLDDVTVDDKNITFHNGLSREKYIPATRFSPDDYEEFPPEDVSIPKEDLLYAYWENGGYLAENFDNAKDFIDSFDPKDISAIIREIGNDKDMSRELRKLFADAAFPGWDDYKWRL